MFKVNNKSTRTTPVPHSGVFIVNVEHISQLALVFLLLSLSRQMPAGLVVRNDYIITYVQFIQSRLHPYCLIWASRKIIQPSFALYRDFYRLLIAAFTDHWVPRMLFVHLIN